MAEKSKSDRRDFLKVAGAGVAGLIIGGVVGSQGFPRTAPGETVTQTMTQTVGSTQIVTQSVTQPPAQPITVVLGDVDELGKLDPHTGSYSQEARLYPNMYDALLQYDTNVPPKVIPLLAEKWDVSPDGKEYTFSLVKGAKFHDGTEVTAEDVAFSLVRSVTVNQGYSFMWQPVVIPEGTEVLDKYTVRMKLKSAFAPFPATMAYLYIMNKKVMLDHLKKPGPYGDMGDYGTEWLLQGSDKGTLSGSGPYRWLERVPGTQDKFERFKDYWRGWSGNPGPIDIWIHRKVPEEATLKTLMRTGEIQQVWSIWRTTAWYEDLAKEPSLRLDKGAAIQLNVIVFNCAKPPLDDVHVRRALSYCFDFDTFTKDIRKGLDAPAPNPSGRAYGMYNDQIAPYTLDLNKAEEELSKSKYSKADIGKRSLEFSWTQPIEDRRLSGLLLKTNAEKVGFKLDLTGHEWMQYASRVTKAETNPDMATVGELGFYPDPDAALYPLFHSTKFPSTQVNPSYYINPEVDKLLDDGRTNTDPAARLEIYKKVEQMIYDDAPMIWTGEVPSQSIMDKRIKGWIYNWDFENYMEYPLYWQP